MPRYRVTGPDGRVYRVTAPEGATQDEVLAYAQQHAESLPQVAAMPVQQAPQAAPSPLGTDLENFAASIGKTALDKGRGLAQSSLALPAFVQRHMPDYAKQFLPDALNADAYYQQLKQDQAAVDQRDTALMSTKAGIAGNVIGNVGLGLLGGVIAKGAGLAGSVLPNTYAGTAASGGLLGALQPLSGDQSELDRLANVGAGATGAVAGRGILSGAGNLIKRGSGAVAGALLPKASPEVADLAKTAINDYGIPLKASQVSDSRIAKTLDSVSSKIPFSGASSITEAQQKAFNRAVASTIGEDADAVTPALYAQAKKRIGQTYDDITERSNIDLTGVQGDLAGVLAEAQQTGSDDSIRAVTNLLGRIGEQAPDGVLPGKAFQSVSSQLGQIAKAGGEKGHYAKQLRGLLDTARASSISPEEQAAWQEANRQYGNLKTIRDLVAKGQVSGDISPAALLGRVTASGAKKEAVASGRGGDLAELAAIGQQFLKDGVPNSGTPERLAAYGILGGAGFAHLPTAAAGIGAARGFQALNASPQVLAKVLRDPSIDKATKGLLLQRANGLGGLLGSAAGGGTRYPNTALGLLGLAEPSAL